MNVTFFDILYPSANSFRIFKKRNAKTFEVVYSVIKHNSCTAEVSKVVTMATKKVQTFATSFAGELFAVE